MARWSVAMTTILKSSLESSPNKRELSEMRVVFKSPYGALEGEALWLAGPAVTGDVLEPVMSVLWVSVSVSVSVWASVQVWACGCVWVCVWVCGRGRVGGCGCVDVSAGGDAGCGPPTTAKCNTKCCTLTHNHSFI